MQSRYYDAQVQRFVSPDMPELLGTSSGIYAYNLYTYCENDPVNNSDYNGYWKISIKVSTVALMLDFVITVLMPFIFTAFKATSFSYVGKIIALV